MVIWFEALLLLNVSIYIYIYITRGLASVTLECCPKPSVTPILVKAS